MKIFFAVKAGFIFILFVAKNVLLNFRWSIFRNSSHGKAFIFKTKFDEFAFILFYLVVITLYLKINK